MSDQELQQPGKFPVWPITDDSIREVFEAMLQDGSWGRYHGAHCNQLRDDLAEFHHVEHAILCSSGTCAVELALRSAGVEAGDEVILAAYDYKANFANVISLQATPVLVDNLPGVPAMDPAKLPEAVSKKTKAILCSHLHGSFIQMDEVMTFGKAHNLPVIEDACQATGGILNGKVAGSIGDVGVLSFGGSKLLAAGRGGAVLTNDPKLAQRIKLHTQRGNDVYPLAEMQAALLVPQLKQLAERNQQRWKSVQAFIETLSNSPVEAALSSNINSPNTLPAFYKLALKTRTSAGAVARDSFAAAARNAGVPIAPAFPALHRIHAKSRFKAIGELENASQLHEDLLTLHHPILLQPLDQVIEAGRRIADTE